MNVLYLEEKIRQYLLEDIGTGDISTEIFSATEISSGVFIAKQAGIFVGKQIIEVALKILCPNARFNIVKNDGEKIQSKDIIAEVFAPMRDLLAAERVILNLLQRLSGIATVTARAIEALDDNSVRVCDTRKTTPGLRAFEKYAVKCGGGYNHRFGLYDGVMLKDNHIAFAGSIKRAVDIMRQKHGHMVKVAVEVETLPQLKEAVSSAVDIIMFDNCSPANIKNFMTYVPNEITTEATGGITPDNINDYRGLAINYISLGFLTHSAAALDISFNVSSKEGKSK